MVTEGLAAAVRAHDKATEARGLRFEAVIEQRIGDLAAAIDSAKKAVELSRSHGAAADLAFALQVLGRLLADDDRDEARARYEEGLEVARRQKMPSPRSTFCMRWAVCIFVRATTSERASSTQKRWISLSRLESGGWR